MTNPTLVQRIMKLPATSAVNKVEVKYLMSLAKSVPENGIITEIGSCTGRSTCALGSASLPSVKVHAVDCWDLGTDPLLSLDLLERAFKMNVEHMDLEERVLVHKNFSAQASKEWDPTLQIDLLFIDGDHSYEGALSDLENWATKVKPGGTIALHDIDRTDTVFRAVKKFFGKEVVRGTITGRIWTLRGYNG